MKKNILLLVLVFPVMLCAGDFEKNYGIGVMHASLHERMSFSFWQDPWKDKSPLFEISFVADTAVRGSVKMISDTPADSLNNYFAPEYFSTDSEKARLDMCCVEKKNNWYCVIINQQQKKTAWVQAGEQLKLLSWLEFFQAMGSIEPATDTINLYQKPSMNSDYKRVPYHHPGTDNYEKLMVPLEIKGSWMKVRIEYRQPADAVIQKEYWIRWRDNNSLLIKYNIMGC